ncbi:MAG: GHKL domain-containing protein [Eubacterium sp.]|nr:GHKL domain-containing protein [Eubacterium sp.]
MISNILMAGIEQAANIMVVDSLFGTGLKRDIGKKLGLILLQTMILGVFNMYQLSGLWMFLVYAIMIGGVKLIYHGDINICILYCIIAFLMVSAIELLFYIPFAFFWKEMVGDFRAGLIGTGGALLVVCAACKKRWINWNMIQDFVKCRYKMLCYICAAVGSIMLFAVSYFRILESMPIYSFIFLILMIVIIFPMMSQFVKNEVELKERSKFEKPMRDVITRIRQQQHQFDAHLQAIYGIINRCQTYDCLVATLKDYMSRIQRMDAFYSLIKMEDPVLSGFLGVKFSEAVTRGIHISQEISVKKISTNIPLTELIGTFGNLIDNAIEEVETNYLKKEIRLSLHEEGDWYEFMISNPIRSTDMHELTNFTKKGYSTKENGELRGLGLYNVLDTINHYKGELYLKKYTVEETDWFAVRIRIKRLT